MSPYSPPPGSPQSSTANSHPHSIIGPPTLPHSIIPAAHCLAPLDDLHLAHLVNEIKPPPPIWSFDYGSTGSVSSSPLVVSNDRLRTDELADLPAPEAERLHAAYDIEDHLDSSPDRLLVYGFSTRLEEILKDVKSTLMTIATRNRNKVKAASINPLARGPPYYAHQHERPRYNRDCEVYVARLWFQPSDGPGGLYKWEKGGSDMMRFELDSDQETLLATHPASESSPITISWCPVEVALSQALEVGHQLLALLHSHHFAQLLTSTSKSAQFRAIDPIIWLVDPVEYAHAQLRETTQWGWSEHHVELKLPNFGGTSISPDTTSADDRRISSHLKDNNRPTTKSHLSQEVPHSTFLSDDSEAISSAALERRRSSTSTQCRSSYLGFSLTAEADDLPVWLEDLLNRRLPNLLSSPDGFFSYDLLHSPQQPCPMVNNRASLMSSKSFCAPETTISPPSNSQTPQRESTPKFLMNSILSDLSVRSSPSRNLGSNGAHLATSVSSMDQHMLSSPGPSHPDLAIVRGHRHAQTNTLRYYPCKACAEHAFKIALSHKLDEERKRTLRVAAAKQAHNLREKTSSIGNDSSFLQSFTANQDHALNITPSSSQGRSTTEDTPVPHLSDSAITSSPQPQQQKHQQQNHHHNHHHHRRQESGGWAMGLGSKGKAVKEAMDREDDEYLTRLSSVKPDVCFGDCKNPNKKIDQEESSVYLRGSNGNGCIDRDAKISGYGDEKDGCSGQFYRCNHHSNHGHKWDEGESVED